jgi:hypothetical protein
MIRGATMQWGRAPTSGRYPLPLAGDEAMRWGHAPSPLRGWGHAPSPLRGWGYPHPLVGESGA